MTSLVSSSELEQFAAKLAQQLVPLLTDAEAAPLLDAESAAELLAVPESWLRAEARANRVPHIRLGRYVRFHRDDLLAWVAERKRGGR